jgi:SAM-dependent methyltransferase
VLDVGCGTGPTTRCAALAVGPQGAVTGLDVSGSMLAQAAQVPAGDGAAPIDWLEADPVTWSADTASYDVVLSRFGVMFFSDPAAAFGHLAGAARAGGRLAIATWAPRRESAMFEVPYRAALEALGRNDELPQDDGPFSLGDPDGIRDLLGRAGWADVRPVLHELLLPYGGGVDAHTAAEMSLDFGPTRIVSQGIDDDAKARVVQAITAALQPHQTYRGVELTGRVFVTTATRPG